MGSKNKLKRFKENESFSNVVQPTREQLLDNQFEHRGTWAAFFGNNNPIVVELGCGKGEYTVGLARKNPDLNYIGIDIKGARFWRGAKTAVEDGLENVAFIRAQIELIESVFATDEVSAIWITFPDPQFKYKRKHHRLTNPQFLRRYQRVLKPAGFVHLKTDSAFLHGYTLGLLGGWQIKPEMAHHDIYKYVHAPEDVTSIQTFYEQQYREQGIPITYIKFSFPNNVPKE